MCAAKEFSNALPIRSRKLNKKRRLPSGRQSSDGLKPPSLALLKRAKQMVWSLMRHKIMCGLWQP
jgi:hypothetical protein